jgi:hypothetical protein
MGNTGIAPRVYRSQWIAHPYARQVSRKTPFIVACVIRRERVRPRCTDDLTPSYGEIVAVARIDATTHHLHFRNSGDAPLCRSCTGGCGMTDDPRRLAPRETHDRRLPFGPGNTVGVLHGIYTQRVRAPIEERMADAIRQSMAEGLGTAYSSALDEHAIRRAARALATIEMTETFIDERGADAVSDRTAELYKTAINQATKWLTELGLTPAARAKLGVDVARQFDLVAALQERKAQRTTVLLCDYCDRAPARYRIRKVDRVICEGCAEDGAHRGD